jgi:hypothetical protein
MIHRHLKPSYALIAMLLILSACATNPARNAEQQGDRAYGQYVIAKEQGAKLLENPVIPDNAKKPLAEAMVASKGPADRLQELLIQYSQVRAQVAAGETSAERLAIVERELGTWLATSKPVIDDLIKAVGELL